MAVDILSYRGDAGLGIGGNGSVGVAPNPDRDQIGQAIRDVSLRNNEWNVLQYQQKIKDRDALREQINAGEKAVGYLLPEYQPNYDRAQKRVEDYFQAYGDQIISDPKKYQEYRSLVRDAQQTASHAQVNTAAITALKDQKSKATLPADQERIQKHIDAQLNKTTSKFAEVVDPYQKLHNMSIDDILKVPDAKKTSYTDPTDPFKSYDATTVDYNDILRFKQNQYINDKTGEAADSIDQFYNQMQDHDPVELGKTLSSIDNQLERYNTERGLKKGDVGFADPVRREAVGGRLILKEPKSDFAAKYALANQSEFVTKTNKFNDKVGSYLNARERISADAAYKKILASNAGARTRAYVDNVKSQIAARKKPEDQAQFMDEMYNRNLLNQDTLVEPVSKLIPGSKGQISFSSIDADNSLPIPTLENGKVANLIPIGAKKETIKGKIIYSGGHYDPQYTYKGATKSYIQSGAKLTPKAMSQMYAEYKDTPKGKEFKGDINDFIKKAVEGNSIDFLIKGANGVVDRKLSLAVQRAISNQNTSKGETPIFEAEPPADEQVPDSSEDTPDSRP